MWGHVWKNNIGKQSIPAFRWDGKAFLDVWKVCIRKRVPTIRLQTKRLLCHPVCHVFVKIHELYQRNAWGREPLPCYVSLSPARIWSHVLKHELSIGGCGKIKVTKHMEVDVRRGFLFLDFHIFHDKAKKNTACKLMCDGVWVKLKWLCGWERTRKSCIYVEALLGKGLL